MCEGVCGGYVRECVEGVCTGCVRECVEKTRHVYKGVVCLQVVCVQGVFDGVCIERMCEGVGVFVRECAQGVRVSA